MLTERQTNLISFLRENGISSVWAICARFPLDYNYNGHAETHDKCATIRTDADAINMSDETDAIIIHDHNYNYWIARSGEEIEDYLEPIFNKSYKSLRKCSKIIGKAKLNGQYKMEDGKMRVVESLASE